jgi:hypothetical protein
MMIPAGLFSGGGGWRILESNIRVSGLRRQYLYLRIASRHPSDRSNNGALETAVRQTVDAARGGSVSGAVYINLTAEYCPYEANKEQ